MSHARNKVRWCLKKAEKELKDKRKHRGLAVVGEDMEKAKAHLKKAEHNLSAVSYFNDGGFSDWSMSAAFYCIYQCFLAIASKFGYESRNQECTIALIRHLKEEGKINLNDKFIEALEVYNDEERMESSIIEKREDYTYGISVSVDDKEEINKGIELCKECLDETREIVFKQQNL